MTITLDDYRVRVEIDNDVDWSWLNQTDEDWAPAPNPFSGLTSDDYDAFVVVTEKECPSCGHYEWVDALHGVTFLRDVNKVYDGTFSFAEIKAKAEVDADWRYVLEVATDGFGDKVEI